MQPPKTENGNGKNTWSAIIAGIAGVVIVVGLIKSFSAPIEQKVQTNAENIKNLMDWQQDYSRGLIPSSAERELAAIREKFIEVETQFKWFKQISDERQSSLLKEIGELKEQLRIKK